MPQTRLSTHGQLMIPVLLVLISLSLVGCGSREHPGSSQGATSNNVGKHRITLADGSWDSIQLHNRLAGFIIKSGYGYPVEYLYGEELPLMQALAQDDVQVMMEIWANDYPKQWKVMQSQRKVKELGTNYTGAVQGWFVPTYMIAGDVERGIEPVAPELKSTYDLPRFSYLFAKNESSKQGRLYNAPKSWLAAGFNADKLKAYHLGRSYLLISTGSEQELTHSLFQSYRKGTPWLGFSRDPGPITAGQQMTLLREPEYNAAQWQYNHGCAYPTTDVLIAANQSLEKTAPELLDFLEKYETSREQNIQLLLYVDKYNGDKEKAVVAFMKQKPDVWKQWVPDDVAKKVEAALAATGE